MKFIHSSDWHIGRLFQNISLLEDQLYVLQQLKIYIQQHEVDVLLISGDLYDRSVPPAEAVDALNDFLNQLITELEISVIVISGNHDSAKRLSFGSAQMLQAGLYILTDINKVTEPVIINSKTGPVSFFAIPYHDPVEVREAFGCEVHSYDQAHTFLVEQIKSVRPNNMPSVLLSHCFIDGAETSDSERPLSVGGADRVSYQPLVDFDYVALGHLHGPQYKAKQHIRYSGSLLKYSFSEHSQQKGVSLVEFSEQGLLSIEHLALTPRRELRIIEGLLADVLQQAEGDPKKDDYLFVRLKDSQDLLDPLAQLREFYPNVLQLERSQFVSLNKKQYFDDAVLKRTEEQVFNDFFQQVDGQPLSDEQQDLLKDIIGQAKSLLEAKE